MLCRAGALLVAAGAGLGFVPSASASPLTMTWSVQPGWDGNYRYTFKLTLDNKDSSWRAGQGFGWIIFGDGGPYSKSPIDDFAADGALFPVGPWTSVTKTAGRRNGPTLSFGRTTWIPTGIGDSLSWSGTSSVLVTAPMRWSAMIVSGGAWQIELEPAAQVAPCIVDVNGDGFVDGIDYDLFNLAFESASPAADVNHDGFVDGIDYDTFNNVFETGC